MRVREALAAAWHALVRPRAGDPAMDDKYYETTASVAASGVTVTPERLQRIGTVYRCISILANSLAMLPTPLFRRLSRGREEVTDHPIYRALNVRPNPYQTPFVLKRLLFGHAILRGNAYARIWRTAAGVELWPLHPDRVTGPELLASGRLRYKYRRPDTNQEETLIGGEDIWHLHGLSSDGLRGLAVSDLGRETFGLAIALEEHGARLFSQGVRPSGILKIAGSLKPETKDRLRESFSAAYAGLRGAHKVPILEDGLEFEKVGFTNEDAQFLESRKFSVAEIARWFGVPPHMAGDVERSTSWGTGIEQQQIAFVTYGLMPWAVLFEQEVRKDFLEDGLYVRCNFGALLRAEAKERFGVYQLAIANGIYSPNECRELEDLNPREGGDVYLSPMNMRLGSDPADPAPEDEPSPAPSAPPSDDKDEGDEASAPPPALSPEPPAPELARAMALAEAVVSRLERTEQEGLTAGARKHPSTDAWRAWVQSFYGRHAHAIAAELGVRVEEAQEYCLARREAAIEGGLAQLAGMAAVSRATLMALALGRTA